MIAIRILVVTLVAAWISGCPIPVSQGPAEKVLLRPVLNPTISVGGTDLGVREVAALGFITYVGETLDERDPVVATKLRKCVVDQLEFQPMTRDRGWKLVWGPMVYRFNSARYDDNMMFAAQRGNDLVIAIRGTNSIAIEDWLFEDFNIVDTRPWVWQRSHWERTPRISQGTYDGLEALIGMRPPAANPGAGQPIVEVLGDLVRDGDVTRIIVVGHSLGGALAPAFGLWLEDTLDGWLTTDAHPRLIHVVSLAGPTPGDKEFARYYDERLRGNTYRIYNPWDVVPNGWETDLLDTLPGLYLPQTKMPVLAGVALADLIELIRDNEYRQEVEDSPRLRGGLFTKPVDTGYFGQVACQHSCGYYKGLRLDIREVPEGIKLPHYCKLKRACEDCKGWAPSDTLSDE